VDIKACTGVYISSAFKEKKAEIFVKDGKLFLKDPENESTLKKVDDNAFAYVDKREREILSSL
jgi:hypothetical protein